MTLNDSIRYENGQLMIDDVAAHTIADAVGTPTYIYSLKQILSNYDCLQAAFPDAHIHYSAKANANLAILRALINAGAGIDCVSGGEIYKALQAGCDPQDIVFAGVGKTPEEIQFALEQGVGWFNVENVGELDYINTMAANLGIERVQVALRLNPNVTANTHPYIATGHGAAKFGLLADVVQDVLSRQDDYPHIAFTGLHIHIGSQLGDSIATRKAVQAALDLMRPYPHLKTVNIGGGFPIAYHPDETIPALESFAETILPLVEGYHLLMEPGRSIVGDAGILVSRVLYTKQQGGADFLILDAGMTDLIRPALYQAHHEIVPLVTHHGSTHTTQVVGGVCESADILGRDLELPQLTQGDRVAILTAGAYGAVMTGHYNARPNPAEVIVNADGQAWQVARRRETWQDLIQHEKEQV